MEKDKENWGQNHVHLPVSKISCGLLYTLNTVKRGMWWNNTKMKPSVGVITESSLPLLSSMGSNVSLDFP